MISFQLFILPDEMFCYIDMTTVVSNIFPDMRKGVFSFILVHQGKKTNTTHKTLLLWSLSWAELG